jgi:hypothetical protein
MNWIVRAETALDGPQDRTAGEVEVLTGRPPPVLDALGRRALLAPLIAGFMWTAASFVEQLRGPLDPIGLILRLLALSMAVRSVVLGAMLFGRIRDYLRHARYALALSDEGMLLRTPDGDVVVAKDDIVDVREQLSNRKEPARWAAVYVVTKPASGRHFVTLPPVFARSPSALVEQLSSWLGRGSAEFAEESMTRDGANIADAERSQVAIEFRRGLPAGGPYATVLLGFALLEGYLRLAQATRERLAGLVAAVVTACVVVVPAAWLLWVRLRLGARREPAMLLDANELGFRRRRGLERVPWSDVTRVDVQVTTLWSLIRGAHEVRTLVIDRMGRAPLRLSQELVTSPVEAIGSLAEAYRGGLLR